MHPKIKAIVDARIRLTNVHRFLEFQLLFKIHMVLCLQMVFMAHKELSISKIITFYELSEVNFCDIIAGFNIFAEFHFVYHVVDL